MPEHPPFPHWPFIVLLVTLGALHLPGLAGVPFHPDEATYLYMSGDFDALLARPASLAWTPANRADPRQTYRSLDAPLTRYTLGVGRSLVGLPALPVDWDWARTWDENQAAGALPAPGLLWAGRWAVTLLLPLSLSFLYATGRAIGGQTGGLVAALLLGTHALVLLHGRRAMAEGVLTLGVTFAAWSLLRAHRRPALAGLGMALAFNAKFSALVLFPVGLLAAVWRSPQAARRWRRAALNGAAYAGGFGLLTLALNPLLWRYPVQAVQGMWLARRDLLARQVADVARLAPQQVLRAPAQRAAVLLANLYLLPPAFAEVGNYLTQTAPAEAAYLANPAHHLLRGVVGGGLLLLLTLFGLVAALIGLKREPFAGRRSLALLLAATLSLTAFQLAAVPLPWQRFSVPLVPFVCLWAGYGVSRLLGSAPLR